MSLVTNSIPAMFNGISQQPASLRLPSQAEEQINGYSSVADGLSKRAPTKNVAKLSSTPFGDAFIHVINRDTANRFAVVITDESLQVFDLSDGTAKTVVFENAPTWTVATAYVLDQIVRPVAANGALFRCTTAGTSHATTEPTWDTVIGNTTADNTVVWTAIDNYLKIPAGAKANESFEIVTVADYSFIVNKTRVVATRPAGQTQHQNFTKWFFPDNWTKKGADTRYFLPTHGTDKGKVQTLADLPKIGDPSPPVNGDFYEIAGNDDSGFSKYYVVRTDTNTVWTETHEKAQARGPDESTMPHALVAESDGDFHFREFGWVPRLFGDDTSNPDPSFVGKKITDIGYHKNRLVFAANENIIFSGAGDYGNFYRNTVTQLLDSDVVDVAVSTKQVSNINFLLPAENGLMFFSDQAQFALNVDQLLTPNTVSIDVATSYRMNPNVKPISVGQDVYFITETGDFSRMREYTLASGDSLATDATDVTAHVPRYLPSGVFRLAGSSNEDLLLAISDKVGFKNRVYVYRFFWSGGDKVQSAWSHWEFAADDVILDIDTLDNEVFFVVERADGVYLEKMNVQNTDFPLALTFDILLDRRHQFLGGEKVFGDPDTTFTLPYPLTSAEQADLRLVEGDGTTAGRLLDQTKFTFPSSTTVKIVGDFTAIEVFAGLNYEFNYKYSQQFHQGDAGSITTGRYQLRTFSVNYENTSFFRTEVDPYGTGIGSPEAVVTKGLNNFTGKTLGIADLLIGSPVFDSGTYVFQIYGNSKLAEVRLTNDQPFNCTFVQTEVEGFFTSRAR